MLGAVMYDVDRLNTKWCGLRTVCNCNRSVQCDGQFRWRCINAQVRRIQYISACISSFEKPALKNTLYSATLGNLLSALLERIRKEGKPSFIQKGV
jgi:hypothetical protein